MYGDKDFNDVITPNALTLLVSGEPHKSAIKINQEATIEVGFFDENQTITIDNENYKYTYLVLIDGELEVDDQIIQKGDSIENTSPYQIKTNKDSHFLLLKLNDYKRR